MSLGLYHVIAPSEARLESVYYLLGTYRVGGVRSAQVWFEKKKTLFTYFSPILFMCIIAIGNVNTYPKLSSTYF